MKISFFHLVKSSRLILNSFVLLMLTLLPGGRGTEAIADCNPSFTRRVLAGAQEVSIVMPGETYRLELSAHAGTAVPGQIWIQSYLSLPGTFVPDSFSVPPTDLSDNRVYWNFPSATDVVVSYSFTVPATPGICNANSSGDSECAYEIPSASNAYFACSNTYPEIFSNIPLNAYLASYAPTDDFSVGAGRSYDVEIKLAAAHRLPVVNVSALGPLQIVVIEGDSDIAQCDATPSPAMIPEMGGGSSQYHTMTFRCSANRKGKLRLTFPGASGVDSHGDVVTTDTILQSGIITITQDLKVNLEFDKASILANSSDASVATATVTVKDALNEAVENQQVNLDGPLWRIAPSGANPRIIICDDGGRRVYPGPENQWPRAFSRRTNGEGRFKFDIFAGTDTGPAGGSSPGLGLGNLFMDARLPEGDITNEVDGHKSATIDLIGEPQSDLNGDGTAIPALSLNTKFKVQGYGLIGSNLAMAPMPAIERGVLNWLLELRSAGSTKADFGPIRSANGSFGILLYPRNNPGPLVDYMSGAASSLPGQYETLVIPFNKVPGSDKYTPKFGGEMVKLSTWEETVAPNLPEGHPGFQKPRGRAEPGIAGEGQLGYQYFGYRYPPSTQQEQSQIMKSRCLNPVPSQIYLGVHSPVRVLVTDPFGNRTGITPTGQMVVEIPESIFVIPAADPKGARFVLPIADLKITLTGTGGGEASMVLLTPGAEGNDIAIYNFVTKKGASGLLNVTAAGPEGALTFGGKRVVTKKNVVLRIAGLPESLIVKRGVKVRLVIKSQFGERVMNALVAVFAGKFRVESRTNSMGIATLSLKKAGKLKKVTLSVTADGYEKITKKIKLN